MRVLNKPEPSDREDAIMRVRALIAEGDYAPGDRLPAERELIDQETALRASLRPEQLRMLIRGIA